MKTQKAISNIAYHRPEVFETIVNVLRESNAIGPCLWISHKAEGGDRKNHLHFILLGGYKTYNTDGLSTLFGFDVIDGEKQSATNLWKPTKNICDWLLYGIHDTTYLLRKGLEKQYSYSFDDVKCTKGDEDTLDALKQEAQEYLEQSGDKIYRVLRLCIKKGISFPRIVADGLIPVNSVYQAYQAYRLIRYRYGEPSPKRGIKENELNEIIGSKRDTQGIDTRQDEARTPILEFRQEKAGNCKPKKDGKRRRISRQSN